jgi:5-methylcytosine-specific restriction enzyme subunit McrC
MWQYAYDLTQFQLPPGLAKVDALSAFYERVVQLLLQAVQKRERQGFYRAYQTQTGLRPFVQGKIQQHKLLPKPAQLAIPCQYETHTADTPENQLLAYTLTQVARARRCTPALQTAVRQTAHHLQSITSPRRFRAADCWTRPYTRLNQDYELMHALCRFLLEHQAPTLNAGSLIMQPFLINAAHLYELFVAKWLVSHLLHPWRIKVQETVTVGHDEQLRFDIDLVLYDGDGRVTAVLDTKYKTPDKASNADISQVITYAQAKNSPQAILIYPISLPQPLNVQLHGLHLRSLAFPLSGNLDEAGSQFLTHLLPPITED